MKTYIIYKDGIEFCRMDLPHGWKTDTMLDELCRIELYQVFATNCRFTYKAA
jgi:hypothetical protein